MIVSLVVQFSIKFGTLLINRLIGVVTLVYGAYFILRKLNWSENIQILLTNLIQNNLGLKGNGCYFKAVSRKSEIHALLAYVRLKLATSKLKNYAKPSLKFTL